MFRGNYFLCIVTISYISSTSVLDPYKRKTGIAGRYNKIHIYTVLKQIKTQGVEYTPDLNKKWTESK